MIIHSMIIREAARGDFQTIGQIYTAAAGQGAKPQAEFWECQIASQGLLVAEEVDRVVGFGTLDVSAEEQIKQLYVAPEFQGRGVGLRLLRELERRARRRGLSEITLHATPGAVAFYRRAGYNPIPSTAASGHDHDGVLMSKRITGES